MTDKYIDLKLYGLSELPADSTVQFAALNAARVIAQEKGLYRLVTENGEKAGEISGKLRYNALTAAGLPAVGDLVMADLNESGGNAVIHQVLPRKSCFIRKAAGESHSEQIVAANIDTVFLCMSLNNDFNLRRLERYLAIAWDSGAVPVIVLTKSDLCHDLPGRLAEVATVAAGVDIVTTTMTDADSCERLRPYIGRGKTVAFIGSSGVGKSTMINRLLGEERLSTGGLRNDDKGRHTTTRRQLFLLPEGGMVIDTPGMRELGMWDAAEGIDRAFADIEELAAKCRFRNCTHTSEPGCAVRQALADGALAPERFASYQKLTAENAYMEDAASYLAAKEKKFKDIAKLNKSKRKR